eukprot:6182758-Pleurochrysis_carterae.AAC.4
MEVLYNTQCMAVLANSRQRAVKSARRSYGCAGCCRQLQTRVAVVCICGDEPSLSGSIHHIGQAYPILARECPAAHHFSTQGLTTGH